MTTPRPSVAAGIDIGNATTEVVLARVDGAGGGGGSPEMIGVGRAPTRRAKGSAESLAGAVALLRRLERQHGVRVHIAAAAPLRPVSTLTATLPEPQESTGRLRLVAAAAGTAGGRGFGVGRPHRLGDVLRGDGPLVAVVPAGVGYLEAVASLREVLAVGRLAAVVLADDEAVLVGNRLGAGVPVVDELDDHALGAVMTAELVAVEVARTGAGLHSLTDPLRIVAALGLRGHERADAARIASRLHDCSNAVIALGPAAASGSSGPGSSRAEPGWVEITGAGRLTFPQAHEAVVTGRVGLATAYAVPPSTTAQAVDDLWTVDLSAVADTVLTRAGGARSRAVGLAALRADAPYADPSPALAALLGIPVTAATTEADASRAGALSTPGAAEAAATRDSIVVIDLGAGTIDAVSARSSVVAAGGGELLSASVASLAGTTSAAAEWVKRGPAFRVEAPQILLAEDGSRDFTDRPAAPETIGSLVAHGPAGLLPFHRSLAPGEWRALRLRLKIELVGANVARALRTLDVLPTTVVVVGGPAGDEEVLSTVSRALPDGIAVGRGDIGGVLGHRYAVAYGLLVRLRP